MMLICPQSLTPEDLPLIEKEMKKIINENIPVVRKEVSRAEAIQIYKEIGDEYKLELIEAIPEDETVTLYEQGDFFDPLSWCTCSINKQAKRN